jgi:hypothetical protein
MSLGERLCRLWERKISTSTKRRRRATNTGAL